MFKFASLQLLGGGQAVLRRLQYLNRMRMRSIIPLPTRQAKAA
jgi:hypothetical protein